MKDKAYRSTAVGGEVGRFMRALRWSDKSQNTLNTYEVVLSRLALDHAGFETLDEFTTDTVRVVLDEHWGEASPATRRNRLAVMARRAGDERTARRHQNYADWYIARARMWRNEMDGKADA